MRLQREVSLGIGAILTLQILLSLLSIVLLTRMGPAVERILQENVYSGKAVEDMLAILATSPKGPVPKGFEDAWQRARQNVTEQAERPPLAAIKQRCKAAFAGDLRARQALSESLRQLGQVNRNSMNHADIQAKRLGYAGAWAFAMLGALALGLGIIVYRRLRQQLEQPIQEVLATTERIRMGNLHARCLSQDWPQETKQIAYNINWLLDQWLQTKNHPGATEAHEAEIHRTLAWLLEQDGTPAMIVDADGQRIAMSDTALALDAPADNTPDIQDAQRWEQTKIPGTNFFIARSQLHMPPPRADKADTDADKVDADAARADVATPGHVADAPKAPQPKQKKHKKKKKKKGATGR